MPQQPQLDLSIEQKQSRQRNNPPTQVYDPETSQSLPTQSVQARGQEFLSAGKGMDQLGGAMQDMAEEQIKANQTSWLLNTKANYELQGQTALNELIAGAQPGQPISGQLQKQLGQMSSAGGKGIVSPRLQSGYQSATEVASTSLLKQAKEFDDKQRSNYAAYSFDQAMLANQNLLTAQPDYDGVKGKYQDMIGEVGHAVSNLPVAPDVKLKLQQAAISGLGVAANQKMQDLDPQRWLHEHSNAMTPEARVLAGPLLTRGIRNNNPGNLKGDDQWQGMTGKDAEGYLQFDTPQSGLRALSINLVNQQDKHGLSTVNDIISKYAPASENDTAAYVLDVSHKMGVQPDQQINLHDPAALKIMTEAIVQHENGSQPHSEQALQAAASTATGIPASADGTIHTTSNPAFNMLPYDEQHKLMHEGVQSLKAEMTAKEAQINIQEKLQKLNADKTMKNYLVQAAEAYKTNDPNKTADFMRSVVHDPNLNFEQAERVLSMQNTVNERGAKTDPAVFNSLLDRTIPGSANPMTDPNEPMRWVGRGIGYEDALHLQNRVENKGTSTSKLEDNFWKDAHSLLTQSTMIKNDPVGEQKYYEAYVNITHYMQKKIQDSKGTVTFDDMLTPGNKEFVGPLLQNFTRNNKTQMKDRMQMMRGILPSLQPSPEAARQPGETAEQWLARTKK